MAKRKSNLQKEMFLYFENINALERKKNREFAKKKKEQKKQKKVMIWGLIIIFIVSVIVGYITFSSYNHNLFIGFISFGLTFVLILSFFDFIVTNNEDRYRFSTKMVFEILTILILIGQLSLLLNQNNILNIQTSISSTQTEILNRTSESKYAYIDSELSQWLNDSGVYALSNIEESIGRSSEVGFNVINTGQMNTDKIGISQYPNPNDSSIYLSSIDGVDIQSKSNNVFWLNITILNQTGLIGWHYLTLRLNCPNCLEQGIVIKKQISLCIYNNTISQLSNKEAIVKDCNTTIGW